MAEQTDRASAVIAEYLRRQDAGEPVDEQHLLESNPDLAEELRRYLENEAAIGRLVSDQAESSIAETARGAAADSVPAQQGFLAELPAELGRYRVLQRLGQGAMGAVYRAHDTVLGRDVALKVPKLNAGDAELALRFEREARAAATLHHRNICPVFDVGTVNGVQYLTMAFIDGKPLSRFIASWQTLTERQIAITVRRLALGLAEAHRHGVVHRDLKPANVMVDKSGEPVIMDFGLARLLDNSAEERLTQVGTIMGTPAYMSPEQVEGDQGAVGPQSDVYSLGVILFELLTGRLPFQGSTLAVLGQIMTADPPDVATLRPGLDPRLRTICHQMLAKAAGDRYQSMQAVVDALSEFLRNAHPAAGPASQDMRPPHDGGSDPAVEEDDELVIFQQIAADEESLTRPLSSRRRPPRTIGSGRSQSRASRGGKKASWKKWTAAGVVGVAGLVLLAGVIIVFDGGSAEVDDGSTVTIARHGNKTTLEITPPMGVAPAADARQQPDKRPSTPSPATPPAAQADAADLPPVSPSPAGQQAMASGDANPPAQDFADAPQATPDAVAAAVNAPATPAPPASPEYTPLLTGQWVSLMDELRRRAADVPSVTPTDNGGLQFDKTNGFVIDWLPARNAILRAKVHKLKEDWHPDLRLRFQTFERPGLATYFDEWNRFGVRTGIDNDWKDLQSKRLSHSCKDEFEWTLAVVEDDVTVYVDGRRVLSTRIPEVESGFPVLGTKGATTVFRDVEVMVLDDDPVTPDESVLEDALVDLDPHAGRALWTLRVPPPVEEEWEDLFNGRTLQGWQSTDTNPKAWRVEDGAIIAEGPGRGYLHCDRPYANFEMMVEYRAPQTSTRNYMVRAPDLQLGKTKAIELTLLDTESLPHTRLHQDGGGLFLDSWKGVQKPLGEWNTVTFRMEGGRGQVWLNGQLVEDNERHLHLQMGLPEHTFFTREAGRVVLQHWSPERVEFRNIRIRELPPTRRVSPPAAPPVRGKGGGFGGGGGGGFGGGGFGGGGFGGGGKK